MVNKTAVELRNRVTEYIANKIGDKDVELSFFKFINSSKDAQKTFPNKHRFQQIQDDLVYEAERNARENPLLALMFLAYTVPELISESQLKRRMAIVEYCLLRVKYEDLEGFPFWIRTKFSNIHAKEKDELTIDVDSGTFIKLFRTEKHYVWNAELYSFNVLKSKWKLPLFVLSKRRIKSSVLADANSYNVYIRTPFVEYYFVIDKVDKHIVDYKVADKRNKKTPIKVEVENQ